MRAHARASACAPQPVPPRAPFHRVLVKCSTCEIPWQYVVLPLPGAPITSCPKPISQVTPQSNDTSFSYKILSHFGKSRRRGRVDGIESASRQWASTSVRRR